MVALYKKIYHIRVDSTEDKSKWYYTRVGNEYEAEIIKKNKVFYFQIDYLHCIPAKYCTIIELKKIPKYFR